ncbi:MULTISPECIES: hypothetical protein [unclassified Aureimonas]|uniref:hypothetical protein n=1 Tax=unclassified Aureimonas TaxID=2615206 RepID=UPI0006F61F06|nr:MULTISPECIES: hypothetical protein [unclassified Aureimonas]KQT58123.1 hypothetical protein ASG62_24725 [Aureimonas sp. Leaf427]KQT65687.1 hypothetical protein ASG54_22670 [Aureimonas sp. Leaf460]
MAILVPPSGEPFQLHEHLNLLKRLVADVEALVDGRHPSQFALSAAPVLERWTLASRSSPCLAGQFLGHPKIRSGRPGFTSDLWIHAPSHGYARTLSRLYRLGDPATIANGADR